jgi:hypothetical protein
MYSNSGGKSNRGLRHPVTSLFDEANGYSSSPSTRRDQLPVYRQEWGLA